MTVAKPAGAPGTSHIEHRIDGGSWVAQGAGTASVAVTIYPDTQLDVRMVDGATVSAVVGHYYWHEAAPEDGVLR